MRKIVSVAVFLAVIGFAVGCKPKPPEVCTDEGKIWVADDGRCVQCQQGKVVEVDKMECSPPPTEAPTPEATVTAVPEPDATPTAIPDASAAVCKERISVSPNERWQCRNAAGQFTACPTGADFDALPIC
jgi:hypothetical protein